MIPSLMHTFKAQIDIIGANPFVFVPPRVLTALFTQAGKHKGPIPVRGTINAVPYKQTLVRFSGAWRLYINTTMLTKSPKRIGETVTLTVEFDPSDRTITPHPGFTRALGRNPAARRRFESLRPSRQREIVRYISSLKTEKAVHRNITRAIGFLSGSGRFVGRDTP